MRRRVSHPAKDDPNVSAVSDLAISAARMDIDRRKTTVTKAAPDASFVDPLFSAAVQHETEGTPSEKTPPPQDERTAGEEAALL